MSANLWDMFFSKWGRSGWALVAFAALSFLPFCSPQLRKAAVNLLAPPDRVVLSVVDNKLKSQSPFRQAAKILTPNGILIEIYGAADSSGHRPLLDTVTIPDRKDAYYHLNSRPTNLALTDTNGDGEPEILAPSFDQEGRPRLNVIQYNSERERFELVE